MAQDPWSGQVEALGQLIHAQRKLAKLSLRELAAMSDISNAYLSQLERGLHQPSMRVVTQVARALGIPAETLLAQAGLLADAPAPGAGAAAGMAEEAIRADPGLTAAQREALLAVLRSFAPE
ncbi:MAG: helix-turn-helix domain-containing protein [Thermoleophilia bacterium]